MAGKSANSHGSSMQLYTPKISTLRCTITNNAPAIIMGTAHGGVELSHILAAGIFNTEGKRKVVTPGTILGKSARILTKILYIYLIACGIREVKREKGMDAERERRGKRRHVRNRRRGPRVARLCFSAGLIGHGL